MIFSLLLEETRMINLENPQEGISREDVLKMWAKYKLYPEPELAAFKESLDKYLKPNRIFEKPPIRLLEVGCGQGRMYPGLPELEGYDISYVGIDIRRDYLRDFKRHYPQAELYLFDVLQRNLVELEMFDVVYAPYTFIHLFPLHVQVELIAKLSTGIRPGGLMVIDTLIKEGQKEPVETFALIPRVNKEPLRLPVWLGTEEFYEEATKITHLSVAGWVSYIFAKRSPQKYLVLQKTFNNKGTAAEVEGGSDKGATQHHLFQLP